LKKVQAKGLVPPYVNQSSVPFHTLTLSFSAVAVEVTTTVVNEIANLSIS
jgi:hypothetical protein